MSPSSKSATALRVDVTAITTGFEFVEAPRFAQDGLYFASRDRVHRVALDGAVDTVAKKSVGGILFHADGGLVLSGRNVTHLDDSAERTLFVCADGFECNDIHALRSGAVLAGTVPIDRRGRWNPAKKGHLWLIDADGATCIADDVGFSNGIGTSTDGRFVFQADTFARRIIRHELDGGRVVGHRELPTAAVDGFPDGLAIDIDDTIWVAMFEGGVVARFSPEGELLAVVEMPHPKVTSASFGGDDRGELYVTVCSPEGEPTAGGIFRADSGAAVGLEVPRVRI